jgi:hypothetical protein
MAALPLTETARPPIESPPEFSSSRGDTPILLAPRTTHTVYGAAILRKASMEYFPAPLM